MKVTPLDIRRKEFKRSVRGYADEEVDLFLDEVADELERLSTENAEMLERMRRQEGELSGNQQLREALEKTLVSAQLNADDTRAKAVVEAEGIVRSAERKAQDVLGESYAEVQRVQQALVQLKQLEEDFRSKFQSLLENHLRVLSEPAIAIPVAGPAMVQAHQAAAAPAAASAPAQATAPVTTQPPAPAAATPFVVPVAFEQVPEYQSVATAPKVDALGAVGPAVAAPAKAVTPPVTPIAAAPAAAGPQPAAEVPEMEIPAVLQPPAPLLWADETADTGTGDAASVDQGAVFPPTVDDLNASISDAPTIISDDSVTLIGEDPLERFFFTGKDDATAAGQPGAEKGGKSKPRDFEW